MTLQTIHRDLTEAQWQREVCEVAEMLGWEWAHFRVSGRPSKAGPPVSGPLGKGHPDLFLIRQRDQRSCYVECKAEKGTLSVEQVRVIGKMRLAGIIVHVWYPKDFNDVVRELT